MPEENGAGNGRETGGSVEPYKVGPCKPPLETRFGGPRANPTGPGNRRTRVYRMRKELERILDTNEGKEALTAALQNLINIATDPTNTQAVAAMRLIFDRVDGIQSAILEALIAQHHEDTPRVVYELRTTPGVGRGHDSGE